MSQRQQEVLYSIEISVWYIKLWLQTPQNRVEEQPRGSAYDAKEERARILGISLAQPSPFSLYSAAMKGLPLDSNA